MAKVITFKVRLNVDGKEQLTTATADVRKLQKAMSGGQASAQAFCKDMAAMCLKLETYGRGLEKAAASLRSVSSAVETYQRGMAQAAHQTGLEGGELRGVCAGAEAVARTFGGDLSSVLKSTNALSKAFGISAQEALRLVKDGFVGGADAQGDFLATLQEYPRYFKEAGLSAGQFVALTANASMQGIYSDKGVDTIMEGNLRLREMTTATASALEGIGISAADVQARLAAGTTTTFQVMQQVSARLKELPASADEVGKAIADIFGGAGEDAGLEYIKSLADVELSMDAVRAGADEYSQALGRQADTQATLSAAFYAFKDALGVVYGQCQPLIDLVGSAISGAGSLCFNLQAVGNALKSTSVGAKAGAAFLKEWTLAARTARTACVALSRGAHLAAVGAVALKVAIRGLLICTGVGAALWALTQGMELLASHMSRGKKNAREMAGGLDTLKSSAEAYADTESQAYGAMRTQYEKLRQAWARLSSEQQKAAWIRENGQAFRDLGLSVESVADAEGVFVTDTDKVEQAFRRRAKAAAATAALTKLYERQLQLEGRIGGRNDAANRRNAGRKAVKAGDVVDSSDSFQRGIAAQGGNSQKVKTGTNTSVAGSTIATQGAGNVRSKQVWTEQGAAQYNATAVGRQWKSVSAAQKADEKALEEVMREQERISGMAAQLAQEEAKAGTKTGKTGKGVGTSASAPKAKAAEAEAPLPEGSIAALNKRMQELRTEQELATDPARYQELQQEIDRCGEEVKRMRGELETPYTPPEISEIKTLQELEKALRHYGDLQRTQGADEAEATQRTIDALERKREAMQRATELPSLQRAAAQLDALTGKERVIKIRALGLDGIEEEIAKLQAMLADTENPVTDSQRKEIEALIQTYKGFRKETTSTLDELQKGWGGVESVSNGIKSMADTLEGDASAWEKLCAVVDGFIQVCEGFDTVSKAVQALTQTTEENTGATLANAGAKGVKTVMEATDAVATEADAQTTGQNTEEQTKNAAATGVAAVAKGVKAGMETTDAAATGVATGVTHAETEATKESAQADMVKSVTEATKQGSKKPFPENLIAIAAGVAAVLGALSMVGSFSTGGVVGGGSPTGDRLLARVNSGEMILNKAQQRKLLEMLNGTRRAQYAASSAAVTAATGAGGAVELDTDGLRTALRGGAVEVEMKDVRLRGSDLYLSMKRYERKLERN